AHFAGEGVSGEEVLTSQHPFCFTVVASPKYGSMAAVTLQQPRTLDLIVAGPSSYKCTKRSIQDDLSDEADTELDGNGQSSRRWGKSITVWDVTLIFQYSCACRKRS
ncbi:MAG TPA: hypothetical protein VGO47_04570, partial [Chlamydiales bacterium]|nr:hypothetical protein [Chlamydiales bacterium]